MFYIANKSLRNSLPLHIADQPLLCRIQDKTSARTAMVQIQQFVGVIVSVANNANRDYLVCVADAGPSCMENFYSCCQLYVLYIKASYIPDASQLKSYAS